LPEVIGRLVRKRALTTSGTEFVFERMKLLTLTTVMVGQLSKYTKNHEIAILNGKIAC
jgi:hypothetical protein